MNLSNIYLLNNKQGLNAHLNETERHPNFKILFYNDYRHDLIMNFLLNSFQSKSNKFMVEPIDNVYYFSKNAAILY